MNILGTSAYLPFSLLWVVPVFLKHGRSALEATPVPQKAWMIMGALDSLAGIMQTLSTNKIASGALIVLLLQSAIPMSMLISRYFLKTTYSRLQYLGAVFVILGLVVVIAPSFSDMSGAGKDTAIFSFVLIASCIPMTLSSVYKELNLGDADIDPIYFNLMIAFYQLLFGLPLLVPSAFADGLNMETLGPNLKNGFKCFTGVDPTPEDNCAKAPLFAMLYIGVNLIYNILIILILKFGSSNVLWLSLVAAVPIQNFIFAIPGVPSYKPLTGFVIAGLPIIMFGLVTYRFHSAVANALRKRGILSFFVPPVEQKTEILLSNVQDGTEGVDGEQINTMSMTPRLAPGTPTITKFARPAKKGRRGQKDSGASAPAVEDQDQDESFRL